MKLEELIDEVCGWVNQNSTSLQSTPQEVTPDVDLLASGILDSLSFITLVGHIEDLTGVELDLLEIDPESFSRVGGLCRFALENREEAN